MTDNPKPGALEDWLPHIEIYMPAQFDDIKVAVEALVESRDAAMKERGQAVYDANELLNSNEYYINDRNELMAERDALTAQLSQKCGCIHANISDGPHPELAAKDRMYATEVCWYHRFVHQESRRMTSQNEELRAAFIGEGLCSNQSAHWCRNCLVWGIDPEPIAHKPDCVVGRMEEK